MAHEFFPDVLNGVTIWNVHAPYSILAFSLGDTLERAARALTKEHPDRQVELTLAITMPERHRIVEVGPAGQIKDMIERLVQQVPAALPGSYRLDTEVRLSVILRLGAAVPFWRRWFRRRPDALHVVPAKVPVSLVPTRGEMQTTAPESRPDAPAAFPKVRHRYGFDPEEEEGS